MKLAYFTKHVSTGRFVPVRSSEYLRQLIVNTELDGDRILQDLGAQVSWVVVETNSGPVKVNGPPFLSHSGVKQVRFDSMLGFAIEEKVVLSHYHTLCALLDEALLLKQLHVVEPSAFRPVPPGLFVSGFDILQIKGIRTPSNVSAYEIDNVIPPSDCLGIPLSHLRTTDLSHASYLVQAVISARSNRPVFRLACHIFTMYSKWKEPRLRKKVKS